VKLIIKQFCPAVCYGLHLFFLVQLLSAPVLKHAQPMVVCSKYVCFVKAIFLYVILNTIIVRNSNGFTKITNELLELAMCNLYEDTDLKLSLCEFRLWSSGLLRRVVMWL
jgi:hypothetical protein